MAIHQIFEHRCNELKAVTRKFTTSVVLAVIATGVVIIAVAAALEGK